MSPYEPRPASMLDWLRTGIYYIYAVIVTALIGLIGLPGTLINPAHAHWVGERWLSLMLGGARIISGVKVEYRGTPPVEDMLIAAKHQSFLDILAIAKACPRRAFVMKREVMNVPVMGWFARKVGCIPIDRSRGKDAMRQIIAEVKTAHESPRGLGHLIFYPEGTRTKPGTTVPYKQGVAVIQRETGLPIMPVAVNCGMFWPKRGFPIRRGTAIVEFLPAISAPQRSERVLPLLAERIEGTSMRLFNEAGGQSALAEN
ncbi:lysophospholipid acyltransferase family protein [Paracoccus aestuariivivens]|uniref:1-acyl-sn-glycerol-3-phosphate acyltransferase n=1 Tax=Paracoccus aestuariivivens TaxID=1820333 RepID=A0A6L6JFS9_9RHOB|nr:lysophospholipid acyltransferase family protein [Paracoccus aestuariivivens]MTH78964.1 1-acyl-sn-glycerol-3-phosphate acyltransferase [Paracoccus aestuariivivens]